MCYEATGFSSSHRITQIRYDEVKSAKSICVSALDIEEKLSLLLDNYHELELELLRLAEARRLWPSRGLKESMTDRLTLDRRLANFLSAGRLYLDQTDHAISGIFGDASEELARIKKIQT